MVSELSNCDRPRVLLYVFRFIHEELPAFNGNAVPSTHRCTYRTLSNHLEASFDWSYGESTNEDEERLNSPAKFNTSQSYGSYKKSCSIKMTIYSNSMILVLTRVCRRKDSLTYVLKLNAVCCLNFCLNSSILTIHSSLFL